MGQILMQDKIATPSHSSGTITLPPSLLTLGGRQYRTSTLSRLISADVTLVANTLYFVYAQIVSGVPALRISTSPPSSYSISNPTALLVTAFYADGGAFNLATPISFGSFVNIDGVPKTNKIRFWGEQSSFGPSAEFYQWERDGRGVRIHVHITAAGSTGASVSWKIPVGILYDSGIGSAVGFIRIGSASYDPQTGNLESGTCLLVSNAGRVVNTYSQGEVAANWGNQWGANSPGNGTWLLGHEYEATCAYDVLGWNNTPLKDL